MEIKIDKKTRKEIEELIYEFYDTLDNSKTNSEHYKKLFSSFDDKQFMHFISLDFPYKFHIKPFTVEPNMEDCFKTAKLLSIPLLEKISLPYLYKDKNGKSPYTQECLVGYTHLKKVQQFITKKNSMSVDISSRDMKTGLLNHDDKNGKTSDRELECLLIAGLYNTAKEFSRPKADYMNSKNIMYSSINTLGSVSLEDLPIDPEESLSNNLFNTYLLGCHIMSTLINKDYYLPYTLKNKKRDILRA